MKIVHIAMIPFILAAAPLACDSKSNEDTGSTPDAKAKADAKADDAKPDDAKADDASAKVAKLVNLNTANEDDFKSIPNVGDKMAHEFDEYRPYTSITQFRKEMGKYVDENTVAGYEKYVFVPIAFNDCDAATLQQIPGVDAAVAEKLIGGRPYDGDVAFLTKVGEVGDAAAEAAAMELIVKDAE